MKKTILSVALVALFYTISACGDEAAKDAGAHTHDDGSVHSDHPADTTKPQQQEFNVADSSAANADTTKKTEHTHKDGKPHSH